MLSKKGRPQHTRTGKRLLTAGLALFLAFIFVPHVHAQQQHPYAAGPSILSVKAGFNGTYRVGNWIPVQVKVNNNGGDFDGLITVTISFSSNTGNNTSTTSISLYQTSINLPFTSQKQVTMYVPIEPAVSGQGAPNRLTIHLQDNNGHDVTSKSASITSVNSQDLYIGLISDQTLDLRQLTGALSGHRAHTDVEPLAISTLPTSGGTGVTRILNNFDLLIFDNATTSALNNDQRIALQDWVNQGGSLVEIGGPEWHTTLGSFPASLLPVTITGTDTIAAGQHLLPLDGARGQEGQTGQGQAGQGQAAAPTGGSGGVDDTLSVGVPVSVGTAKPGSLVLLATNNIPLIVQANVGQGLVYYLAYDPFLDPLVNWTNTSNLWTNLLLRTLGDQILAIDNTNSGYTDMSMSKYSLYGSMNSFLESLVPNAFPSIWLILTLLISYVLILGPLRLLLIRWTKKKAWSWRIVVATIVLFSLLSYGLALQVKGTSVVSSNVSVIQLSPPDKSGSQAHVTDYIGVYVPSQGDFHVHIPSTSLVEATDQYGLYNSYMSGPSGQSSSPKTTITTQASGTDVNLQGVDTWTLRTLAAKYDTHMQGGITSNLSFSQQTIKGTITNTLPYALNDAYLLVGNSYYAVGSLGSNQTRSIKFQNVKAIPPQTNNGGANTLADQIARNKGVDANPYGNSPFNSNQSPDENYRHIVMLETLSGGNCGLGPCPPNYTLGIGKSTGPIPAPQPHLLDGPERGYPLDPLLMAGAPVTIIGWINNSLNTNNITINNGTATGTRESLLQAPLNLHFTGAIDLPPALSIEQVVHVQPGPNGNEWPQTIAAGIYSLSTGSLTFEIQLPITGNLQDAVTILTFSETNVTVKYPYLNSGQTLNDVNTMNIGLYNWQTNTWDGKTFNKHSLQVNNAQQYIDPNGRILIQFANGQNAQNAALFTMPGVELNTTLAA